MCSRYDDPSQIDETPTMDCGRCHNPTTEGNLRMMQQFHKLVAVCGTCAIAIEATEAKLAAAINTGKWG